MSDALSIHAAARECRDAPALRIGAHIWTFGELAAMTAQRVEDLARRPARDRPHAMLGNNTLETALTLYALWECGRAPLLLHPRLTDHERAALLASAERCGDLEVPDAAAVLCTSGTTGAPRAAILTRAAFEASAAANAANMGWRHDDCWLLCMPLAHVGGLSILTRCLIARRCVALGEAFDAARFAQTIARQRVTLVSLVPTMLARVLDAGWTPPAHLRAVLLGGAHASPRLLQCAVERSVPVLVTYGLTETCSQVTTTPYELRRDPRTCGAGKALPGIDVRVRDSQIEVRGPVLMDRYWTQPRIPTGAWLPTGDLGSIDADGFLHVHARRDDVIVTGGENVYPLEVENALEACPGVLAAGVFGVDDDVWGQVVAAALVLDGATIDEAGLRDYVQEHLAPHKRPRQFLRVDQLPHTRAGKLDRAALPALRSAAQARWGPQSMRPSSTA